MSKTSERAIGQTDYVLYSAFRDKLVTDCAWRISMNGMNLVIIAVVVGFIGLAVNKGSSGKSFGRSIIAVGWIILLVAAIVMATT